MTIHKESEALRKYLASEELWLRDVQRERGGRVYLETLGEKMVSALVVALQGGDETTTSRGKAFFDMVFGIAGEYALVIKDETVMLRSFLRGFGNSIADTGLQISATPIEIGLEDDLTAFTAGGNLARHLRVVMVWTDTKWAVENLREQIATLELTEEVHLRKLISGIKGELIQKGILEDGRQETI